MKNEMLTKKPCPVGRWTINQSLCTVCGECIEACLKRLLEIKQDVIVITDEKCCNQCGDCAAACGYNAIKLT